MFTSQMSVSKSESTACGGGGGQLPSADGEINRSSCLLKLRFHSHFISTNVSFLISHNCFHKGHCEIAHEIVFSVSPNIELSSTEPSSCSLQGPAITAASHSPSSTPPAASDPGYYFAKTQRRKCNKPMEQIFETNYWYHLTYLNLLSQIQPEG